MEQWSDWYSRSRRQLYKQRVHKCSRQRKVHVGYWRVTKTCPPFSGNRRRKGFPCPDTEPHEIYILPFSDTGRRVWPSVGSYLKKSEQCRPTLANSKDDLTATLFVLTKILFKTQNRTGRAVSAAKYLFSVCISLEVYVVVIYLLQENSWA